MKQIIRCGVTLASVAFAGVLVTACAAEPGEEEGSVTTESAVAAGPRIWQFNRECGTAETGPCPAPPACPQLPNGKVCGTVGERCITGPNPAGRRKVFACAPTYAYSWAFNGSCEGNATCLSRPACPANPNGVAGAICTTALERCVSGGRVFVCLQNGKDQYVFNGHCGKNGGPSCASIATSCPAAAEGVAGLACTPGTACKLMSPDGISGKVFSCVAR